MRKDLNARIDELVKKPKSKASNRKKRTGDDDVCRLDHPPALDSSGMVGETDTSLQQ